MTEIVFSASMDGVDWAARGATRRLEGLPELHRSACPGCYTYQIDTSAGTWTVVFLARGQRV